MVGGVGGGELYLIRFHRSDTQSNALVVSFIRVCLETECVWEKKKIRPYTMTFFASVQPFKDFLIPPSK